MSIKIVVEGTRYAFLLRDALRHVRGNAPATFAFVPAPNRHKAISIANTMARREHVVLVLDAETESEDAAHRERLNIEATSRHSSRTRIVMVLPSLDATLTTSMIDELDPDVLAEQHPIADLLAAIGSFSAQVPSA